jgi:hypothetical protein
MFRGAWKSLVTFLISFLVYRFRDFSNGGVGGSLHGYLHDAFSVQNMRKLSLHDVCDGVSRCVTVCHGVSRCVTVCHGVCGPVMRLSALQERFFGPFLLINYSGRHMECGGGRCSNTKCASSGECRIAIDVFLDLPRWVIVSGPTPPYILSCWRSMQQSQPTLLKICRCKTLMKWNPGRLALHLLNQCLTSQSAFSALDVWARTRPRLGQLQAIACC